LRYIVTLLILLSFTSGAQTIQGVVTDAVTAKPLTAVTVVNVASQMAVYSNDKGFYSIIANPGDFIVFTYVGYRTVEKPKPLSVLISTMNITMEHTAYELQEYNFRPGNLTPYQIDSLDRATTYKIQLQRRPPSAFVSPVSALAEKFSKKAKRTYQFQKDFAKGETEKFIDTRYTPDLVVELTHLTGDSIGNFMYTYPMEYDFARSATDLEMKIWIRENFKQWIKKP
jgi:hypothetical protein